MYSSQALSRFDAPSLFRTGACTGGADRPTDELSLMGEGGFKGFGQGWERLNIIMVKSSKKNQLNHSQLYLGANGNRERVMLSFVRRTS